MESRTVQIQKGDDLDEPTVRHSGLLPIQDKRTVAGTSASVTTRTHIKPYEWRQRDR